MQAAAGEPRQRQEPGRAKARHQPPPYRAAREFSARSNAGLRVLLRFKAGKVGEQRRPIHQATATRLAGLFEGNAFYFPLDAKPGQNRPRKAGSWFMFAGFRKSNPDGFIPGGRDIAAGFLFVACACGFNNHKRQVAKCGHCPHRELLKRNLPKNYGIAHTLDYRAGGLRRESCLARVLKAPSQASRIISRRFPSDTEAP